MSTAAAPEGWSEYQITRARNIERHNAKLRSLGLISAAEEKASNSAAWGGKTSTVEKTSLETEAVSDGDEYVDEGESQLPSRKRKRNKKSHSNKQQKPATSPPSRQSLRLKGLEPDGCTKKSAAVTRETLQEQRAQRHKECREARLRAAVEHAALGAERAAKENPTATYEHCLMRVTTMTDEQLRNRVKTIERCAGKHCVVKMAIMASCLRDEGLWELAEVATASLERLKALKPPPEA